MHTLAQLHNKTASTSNVFHTLTGCRCIVAEHCIHCRPHLNNLDITWLKHQQQQQQF